MVKSDLIKVDIGSESNAKILTRFGSKLNTNVTTRVNGESNGNKRIRL